MPGVGSRYRTNLQDADFPAGAYQNIYADNSHIENLIADPRVQGVSLTGSERAGAAVAEIAGRHLKKVVLELGGSDPFILLSTDDLDQTVAAAVAGRLENAGQACNAAKRMIVHENLYDEFIVKFSEKILASTPAPLSSMAAAERLEQQVAGAVADGATLIAAGPRAGAHHPPGVLIGVRSDSVTYREELFGPIAMVFKIRSEEEAVEIANDTPYGLGSYVFTVDAAQAVRVADQLDVGMVFINGVGAEGPELPSAGSRGRASAASWAATAWTSSSIRSSSARSADGYRRIRLGEGGPMKAEPHGRATVDGIYRYPVKGLGGERLRLTRLTASGVDFDRVLALPTGAVPLRPHGTWTTYAAFHTLISKAELARSTARVVSDKTCPRAERWRPGC